MKKKVKIFEVSPKVLENAADIQHEADAVIGFFCSRCQFSKLFEDLQLTILKVLMLCGDVLLPVPIGLKPAP